MSCTFTYRGKSYSTQRIKDLLIQELPSRDQQENIQWLQDNLNMTRDEVLIVAGLIDNKSLGRFKADGRIILSDSADLRVAKHEAFHRVWRMYLTPEERLNAIRQFKYKSNWKDLIQNYRKYYPDKSDEDLIEEYFADEFGDYQLQEDSYNVQPLKSLFSRLLSFIKKVFGLKPDSIRQIYNRILSKEFTYKPRVTYSKDADSVFIGQSKVPISVSDKNDLVNFASQRIINKLVNRNLEEENTDLVDLLKDYAWGEIDSFLKDNVDLSEAIGEDFDTAGEIWQGVMSKLQFFGLTTKNVKIKSKSEEQTDLSKEDEEVEQILGDNSKTREFTQAIKIDPKQGLSARIKMLLASFQHPTDITEIGVPKIINASTAFAQITARMSGVPTSNFLQELEKLDLPFIKDLTTKLGKVGDTYSTKYISLQNEFISKLALTENNFSFFQYGTDDKKNLDIRFADLNSETRTSNIVRGWQRNLLLLTSSIEEDPVNGYKQYFEILKTKNTIPEIAAVFGINLDSRIEERVGSQILLIKDLMLNKYKFVEQRKSLYDQLDIAGTIKSIAHLQSVYEENVDNMIAVLDTKIYALGLNTYQTIMLNKASFFIQQLKSQNKSNLQVVEEMRVIMPEMFNNWNMTKTDIGWSIQPLLSRLLNQDLKLRLPYVSKNNNGDELYVDKMSEPELVNMHLNGAVTGNYISIKHSDRSTFFSYQTTPLVPLTEIIDPLTITDKGINTIVNALVSEIKKEVEFAQSPESNLPNQYIGNKDRQGNGYSALIKTSFVDLINGAEISQEDISDLTKMVKDDFKKFEDLIEDYQMYDTTHTNGLSKTLLNEIKTYNLPFVGDKMNMNDIKTYLLMSYVNEHLFHIYESRLFSGDNRVYKSANDLYKRLATQSSNGLLAVTDDRTNSYIRAELDQDYEVFNIETGKTEVINTASNLLDTKVRSVTSKEQEIYQSRLLQPSGTVSKLGIENQTIIGATIEFGFLQDFPNPSDEQKEFIKREIKSAENSYSKINENDGQSYMTLSAFKNYMIRFGTWTDEMDVSYQIEMALLKYKSLEDAKNMEITITGSNKYNGMTFRPFVLENGNFKKRTVDGKKLNLEALHTLKVQYAGPSQQEIYAKGKQELNYSFFTVFKTSNHLLQPSAIMGTNLQSMNYTMLKNNVQVMHMGSANKVGGVDPKLAALQIQSDNPSVVNIQQNGLTFYKGSKFNQEDFLVATDPINGFGNTIFDWEYYKDQVKIGNKEKGEIPGSTQSLKILLSNLLVNGQERFNGALDIVKRYSEIVDQMVLENRNSFLEEVTSIEKLKEVVMSSSQVQDAPDNLKNTIENFFKSPETGLETLTVRQKIENVLYSLVTSNVIDFNRAGTSLPQAASTGYEEYNTRQTIGDKIQSQYLDFYEPVFDENGNVTKVKPAEIIIPLPTKWIPGLMKTARTNNLVDAINWLNKQVELDKSVEGDKFIVKGLRIPNQQLGSNDLFRIKKFTLPTIQSYVIVPSEIVTKVGSDLKFVVRVKLG